MGQAQRLGMRGKIYWEIGRFPAPPLGGAGSGCEIQRSQTGFGAGQKTPGIRMMRNRAAFSSLVLAATFVLAFFYQYSTRAQGTIMFRNKGPGFDAPFLICNGLPVSGPNWSAELMIGTTPEMLLPAAPPAMFLTGEQAGYVNAGLVAVPNIPGEANVFAQIRAWDRTTGDTYDSASVKVSSSIFTAMLGGGTSIPTPPGDLTGLGSNPVNALLCPEPPASLMMALGATVLAFIQRGLRARKELAQRQGMKTQEPNP